MSDFDRFRAYLDEVHAAGGCLRLWLRDDDAVCPTDALDRLLALMNAHSVPGLLAVIPSRCTDDLAARIAAEPLAWVATHGWAHENHQGAGAKQAEFGADRSVADCATDMKNGRRVIEDAFAEDALSIFVPPWNRIGEEAERALPAAGFSALSVFGAARPGSLPQMNTHVDLIDWRGTRGGRPAGLLLEEIAKWGRSPEPAVGVLAHHLDHDEAAWAFLSDLMAATTDHPGVAWVDPKSLLASVLDTPGAPNDAAPSERKGTVAARR